MNIEFKENQIVGIKSLSLKRPIFNQIKTYSEKDITSEFADVEMVKHYLGYAIEHRNSTFGDVQTHWFIFKRNNDTELGKIKANDIWWLLRSILLHDKGIETLESMLPQIYID